MGNAINGFEITGHKITGYERFIFYDDTEITTQSLIERIVGLNRAKYFEKIELVGTANCNYNLLAPLFFLGELEVEVRSYN